MAMATPPLFGHSWSIEVKKVSFGLLCLSVLHLASLPWVSPMTSKVPATAPLLTTLPPFLSQCPSSPSYKKPSRTLKLSSGLALKPSKCNIIPLRSEPTSERLAEVSKVAAKIAPYWKDFKVTTQAEYLGVMIGPNGGTETSWKQTTAKI